MPKASLFRPVHLNEDGHVITPLDKLYRLDSFYAFGYTYTPAEIDQNHMGHLEIHGYRSSGNHDDIQVLLFQEDGIATKEQAYEVMVSTLEKLGFEVLAIEE